MFNQQLLSPHVANHFLGSIYFKQQLTLNVSICVLYVCMDVWMMYVFLYLFIYLFIRYMYASYNEKIYSKVHFVLIKPQ